ncbi:MAG: T9SS type A sorting domain-containing protein, partial [Paludibacter sp.]
ETPTALNQINNEAINISVMQNAVTVVGIQVSSIDLFNTLGQKVKSVTNSNELRTDNLKGVYIVQVKAEGRVVKTSKVSIR